MDSVDAADVLEFGVWDFGGFDVGKPFDYPAAPKRLVNVRPDGKKKSNKAASQHRLHELLLKPVSLRAVEALQAPLLKDVAREHAATEPAAVPTAAETAVHSNQPDAQQHRSKKRAAKGHEADKATDNSHQRASEPPQVPAGDAKSGNKRQASAAASSAAVAASKATGKSDPSPKPARPSSAAQDPAGPDAGPSHVAAPSGQAVPAPAGNGSAAAKPGKKARHGTDDGTNGLADKPERGKGSGGEGWRSGEKGGPGEAGASQHKEVGPSEQRRKKPRTALVSETDPPQQQPVGQQQAGRGWGGAAAAVPTDEGEGDGAQRAKKKAKLHQQQQQQQQQQQDGQGPQPQQQSNLKLKGKGERGATVNGAASKLKRPPTAGADNEVAAAPQQDGLGSQRQQQQQQRQEDQKRFKGRGKEQQGERWDTKGERAAAKGRPPPGAMRDSGAGAVDQQPASEAAAAAPVAGGKNKVAKQMLQQQQQQRHEQHQQQHKQQQHEQQHGLQQQQPHAAGQAAGGPREDGTDGKAKGKKPSPSAAAAPAPKVPAAAASLVAALGGRAAVTAGAAKAASGPNTAAPAKKPTHAAALAVLQQKNAAAAAAAAAAPAPGAADHDEGDGDKDGRSGGRRLLAAPGASKRGAAAGGFLDRMRARLAGGRFRYLNEELYTRSGDDAFEMMKAQPELFSQYHDGFQRQTRGWPKQPVDVAIAWLRAKKSEIKVVADFGCGDAKIAASVPQTVHSFDLVASAPGVVACNMSSVPLRDGEVDAAVFSLALMGTDYGSYLEEAYRVLKPKGWLWVAEVRSRFAKAGGGGEEGQSDDSNDEGGGGGGAGSAHEGGGDEDFHPFLDCLKRLGFRLLSQDAANKMFVVWVLRKGDGGTAPGKGGGKMRWPMLKACVYKKR